MVFFEVQCGKRLIFQWHILATQHFHAGTGGVAVEKELWSSSAVPHPSPGNCNYIPTS